MRADEITAGARAAVADLVGASDPNGVVLGPNMTTLDVPVRSGAGSATVGDRGTTSWCPSSTTTRMFGRGCNGPTLPVSTFVGHGSNVRSGELPVDSILGPARRTHQAGCRHGGEQRAGNSTRGARDHRHAAHDVGALAYVDGVHSTAHGVTDIAELGSDFYVTSAYKWDGPHVGASSPIRRCSSSFTPFKLASSADDIPDRFEWGTPSFANFAGVTAAVDHLAALDTSAQGRAGASGSSGR